MEETKEYQTLQDFWPFYLGEHSNDINRKFHFTGTFLGLILFILSLFKKKPLFIVYGFLIGYAFAWVGHFFVEKNKPATFKYPIKSFISDWKMFYFMLSGKLKDELDKYEIVSK
jgi:hypothetical protein